MLQVKGAEKKVNRRSQDTYHHHHRKVAQRIFEQLHILHPEAEAESQDGSHHRGDKHSADDDRNRVHVQAYGRDDNGAGEDENRRALEINILPYRGAGPFKVHIIREAHQRPEKIFYFFVHIQR